MVSIVLTVGSLMQMQARQVKLAMRKERNKEAARRSNYNKKVFRQQLEQVGWHSAL
jgi:hypothetical protein